jgi:hypothetical protein
MTVVGRHYDGLEALTALCEKYPELRGLSLRHVASWGAAHRYDAADGTIYVLHDDDTRPGALL